MRGPDKLWTMLADALVAAGFLGAAYFAYAFFSAPAITAHLMLLAALCSALIPLPLALIIYLQAAKALIEERSREE